MGILWKRPKYGKPGTQCGQTFIRLKANYHSGPMITAMSPLCSFDSQYARADSHLNPLPQQEIPAQRQVGGWMCVQVIRFERSISSRSVEKQDGSEVGTATGRLSKSCRSGDGGTSFPPLLLTRAFSPAATAP